MTKKGIAEISLNDEYCGRCSVCSSICPYEAISSDPETNEVKINVEKCQFCGLCYSACPVNAIEIAYYDYDKLSDQAIKKVAETNANTLVLMCRGNSPTSCEVENILEDEGHADYLPIRIPCVGRVPLEFVLKILSNGVNKIIAIRCEEDFCRFKEGSRISNQRLSLMKQVLEELGFEKDVLKTITCARKAVYDTDKCVGCDKCVFICPYEAIEVENFGTPKTYLDKCVGCGACALVCPHSAIQVEGFEYEALSRQIQRYGTSAQELKDQGFSPHILVFCCQWSEFSALDQTETRLFDKKISLMEIPCFKGLDPYLVIEALHSGFDGVLAVVCSETDCKLEKGYDIAKRNIAMLNNVLKEMKLQDRFEIYTASPRDMSNFNERLGTFIERIGLLPRSMKKLLKARFE